MYLVLLQNWQVCSKTHRMIKQAFGVDVLGQTRIYNQFILKIAECQVTMMNVLDELPSLQCREKLQHCVKLSARTAGERSMTFAALWGCRTRHATAFYRTKSA